MSPIRLLPLLLSLWVPAAPGAPASDLWPVWQAHDPGSTVRVEHAPWGRFLARYVVRDGDLNRVRYADVSAGDRAALDAYLETLAAVAVSSLARPEQFAYWVNLYNALTVREVLAHFPVDSIREIRSGLFFAGPWRRKLIVVEGRELSLDDIEHRILRPIWGDPRIHYAVNCAAFGCPNLQREPFTRDNAERLLEQAAGEYVNSERGVRLRDGRLLVSSIYDWYAADFGGSETAVLAHLRAYAATPLRERLAARRSIDGYAYDWGLNGALD